MAVETKRVMLLMASGCKLPEYVRKPAFYRFGYCTVDVPADRLEELANHSGVLGVSVTSSQMKMTPEERKARARKLMDNQVRHLHIPAPPPNA